MFLDLKLWESYLQHDLSSLNKRNKCMYKGVTQLGSAKGKKERSIKRSYSAIIKDMFI